jgi:YfiH family protein
MSPVTRARLGDSPDGLMVPISVLPGLRAGLSLERAGDMALSGESSLPWRSRLLAAGKIPRDRLFSVRQVHSLRLEVVNGQSPQELARREADGLLTARREAVLSVTVADCLPIFLADPRTGAFGILHSGWKGTGIVREALEQMRRRFGSREAEVRVVIGPGIGPCCYTVPEERAECFSRSFGTEAVVRGSGLPRLDLRAANVGLLRQAGVRDIVVLDECTGCSPRLGSFRRQGQGFTRMLAWIGGSGEGPGPAAGEGGRPS